MSSCYRNVARTLEHCSLSVTNREHLDVERWKKNANRITADRILTVSAPAYMWSEV